MAYALQKELFEKYMLVDRYVDVSNDNFKPDVYVKN